MIIGLGTDIVSIERIAKVLEKNKAAFIDRICTNPYMIIFGMLTYLLVKNVLVRSKHALKSEI